MKSTASHPSAFVLERAVIIHASIYVIMATWMFGGLIYWAYPPLVIWGLLGTGLTVVLWWRARGRRLRHTLYLMPFLLLATQMIVSTINPSHGEFMFYGSRSLRPVEYHVWAPSSAYPSDTLRDLLLYSGLYCSAYNLFLGVRTRRSLRIFALVAVINGGILAVFGTVQKLVGAEKIFGLQSSPNPTFFASFPYHNHWSAFALVTACLGLALVAHYLRRDSRRDWWHSPALSLVLPALLLALSIPLTSSRSGTLSIVALGALIFLHVQRVLRRRTRGDPLRSLQLNSAVLIITVTLTAAGYYLAEPIIKSRIDDTVRQMQKKDHYAFEKTHQVFYGDARLTLYRDTWRMFQDRPVFGWGFGNYGKVFTRYNSQHSTIDRHESTYIDAHSDWLEALTEIGAFGAILLLGMAAGPLWSGRRMILRRAETGYALLGATLLAAYALVEFPFANPAVVLSFWCTLFYAARTAQINELNHNP